MKTNLSLDHSVVTVHHNSEVVHVMIDLEAPEAPSLQRAPLDVVLVLDRSGSMRGAPLASVIEATAGLLRLAHPNDRIGVVAFDNQANMVLPLDGHDAASAAPKVRAVHSGGSTNLSGGWLKAFEMLSNSPRIDALRRIVVLTDGHANAGVTGPKELSALMNEGKIANLTTSFIGFSTGYDEELLGALSLAGSGNNYYCEGPDQAAAVFVEEFQGLASVVAQNISVEVVPTSVVASCAVLHEFPLVRLPGGGAQIEIGDAYGRETRRVVLGFNLRPLQEEGMVDIASLTIRWTTATGNLEMHAITMPVSVIAGQSGVVDTGADPRVRDEVLVLKVAKSRKEAQSLADDGNYERAADVLEQARKEIEPLPALRAEVQQLEKDVARLRSRLWDLKDKKMNYARSQELHRKRKAQFIDEMDQQDRLGGGTDQDDAGGQK